MKKSVSFVCVRVWYTSFGLGVGTGASVTYLSVSKPPNSVTRIALITRAIPQTEKKVLNLFTLMD